MLAGLRNPLTRMKINQQLILLFLMMVSPILFLHWYGNAKAEQILKKHVTDAYAELNKQSLTLISRDMDTVTKVTSTLIRSTTTQQLIANGEDDVLERVTKYRAMEDLLNAYSTGAKGTDPVYYSFYVYDPKDYYFFAPKIQMTPTGVYFFTESNKPDWYDKAVARKGKGFMEVIDSNEAFADQKTLAYIRAVNNVTQSNGVIGVLVVTRMEDKVGESLKSVNLPDGEMYVTDPNHIILASSERYRLGMPLELPSGAALPQTGGKAVHYMDEEHIYIINNNSVLHHNLIYKLPVRSLLQQQNELKRVILMISVAYGLFGCILITYFWRSLMTPLQKLAMFVRSYVPGKRIPETPAKNRDDEVGILITSMYDMARRLNSLIQDQYQMEIKQKEAQLQILYEQINPHLLYNTLESIYWKSSLEGNNESAEMIKDLSKLMKISLSRGRELITIGEELEHARAYTKLQQQRYDYKFSIHWDVPEEIQGYLIPKISLQPLIENAILHGIKHMEEDGEIRVWGRLSGEQVELRVEDNGFKELKLEPIEKLLNDEKADASLGYGIRNVTQRIRLHFGQDYGLYYRKRIPQGTEVVIVLPQTSGSANHEELNVTGG
ncbi:histidine kinase [Paenibacillus swuensis]|uniref:Histidine kinase n=1 Tax=Paenibacillus swuensis TaxID=1178515 RepID=A0A172TMV3_9BACL|nr:sensor histidine kinase [Paenibacillus swuensis]ANE48395.1 histidine kinase [Paenibacillus swuensis]